MKSKIRCQTRRDRLRECCDLDSPIRGEGAAKSSAFAIVCCLERREVAACEEVARSRVVASETEAAFRMDAQLHDSWLLGAQPKIGLLRGNFEGKNLCYCIDKDRWDALQELFSSFFTRIGAQCCTT